MEISGFWLVFLVGCFGGIVGEAQKWLKLSQSKRLPLYAQNPLYWIISVVMVVLGGLLTVLYGVESKNAILVFNIGLSAPLIIKALAQVNPVANRDTVDVNSFLKGE